MKFAYPTRKEKPVLTNLSLNIKAGRKYAIVGPSGTGKSTIFQLLLRMYDTVHYEGHISIDGIDIKDWDINYLRQKIAIVDQDADLFNTTIAENIRYVENFYGNHKNREWALCETART